VPHASFGQGVEFYVNSNLMRNGGQVAVRDAGAATKFNASSMILSNAENFTYRLGRQ
jgi:hypothetical protein